MAPLEFLITRSVLVTEQGIEEGYALGDLTLAGVRLCYTLEDQDRHLEDGNGKIYGKSAMPLGRYALVLYQSPKHGLVPLFKDVPGFTFTEMHKANFAKELLGCVALGMSRTASGVANCAPALRNVVQLMLDAQQAKRQVFCTIARVA